MCLKRLSVEFARTDSLRFKYGREDDGRVKNEDLGREKMESLLVKVRIALVCPASITDSRSAKRCTLRSRSRVTAHEVNCTKLHCLPKNPPFYFLNDSVKN